MHLLPCSSLFHMFVPSWSADDLCAKLSLPQQRSHTSHTQVPRKSRWGCHHGRPVDSKWGHRSNCGRKRLVPSSAPSSSSPSTALHTSGPSQNKPCADPASLEIETIICHALLTLPPLPPPSPSPNYHGCTECNCSLPNYRSPPMLALANISGRLPKSQTPRGPGILRRRQRVIGRQP